MGLTSKSFIVALALAALALCGLAVWLWPRAAGPGPRALSGRIALLLGSQLAVLAVVAALGNAYFGFYTSWNDLFGTGAQGYHVNNHGAVAANVNSAQLSSASAGQTTTTMSATSVTTLDLTGLRSGISARLRVYVPPQYADPAMAQQDFPIIVIDATGEQSAASDVQALGHEPHPLDAVVVVVDTADGSSIPCTDQPGGAQGGLFWSQDLRSAIAAHYRVALDPGSWGMLGTGPDATCALVSALSDSTRYSAAAVLGPPRHSAFDPVWYLNTYPAPPSRILLSEVSGTPTAFLGHVRAPLQVTETPNTDVQGALTWLTQSLQPASGPRP
ncbi:MAG TPA: hypothetical protein VFU73_05095 [Actinocrinis sp.]|nr:hypothetical protein [Actinocrinis sp.]